MVIALVAMSALLHFMYLASPREVVFDEVHFGKFVSAYCCTGERIFDIHPPHAKLLIAAAVGVTNYDGSFDFDHIGEAFGSTVPVMAFRFIPALCGTLLPLLIYILLLQLGTSPRFALLGGAAVLFENALLVQTRLIALDGILLVATFGAISAALAAQQSTRVASRWSWWAVAGLLAGLAVGVKFTGLAALAIVMLMMVRAWWNEPTGKMFRRVAGQALVVVGMAVLVYIGGWYMHFALLTQPGSGDVWQIPTGHFWQDTVQIHQHMLSANYHLSGTHPYSSAWWSWPLMMRSVFYWQEGGGMIYFLGNPAVWWGMVAGLVGSLVMLVGNKEARVRAKQWLAAYGWLPVAGYLISYAPLINVPRVLFLYHYATPLLFSLLIIVGLLDRMVVREDQRSRLVTVTVIAFVVGFCIFAPLTFGWPLPLALQQSLFWLPTWR